MNDKVFSLSPTPHLLFINQYFPPDTSATARVAEATAQALAEQYQVTVLAGRPSYAPTETHPYYLHRTEKITPTLSVARVGSTGYHRGRMKQRVLNYISYMGLALPRAMVSQADAVITMTDPPIVGLLGALLARWRGKPFIYSVQDLHPDMALTTGMVQPSGWVNRWEQLHRWVLRQASQIVVLGEDMRERVIAKGIDPARVVVIRSGAVLPDTIASAEHPVAQTVRSGFDFVALHAGNLGFYGAWETVIAGFKLLAQEDEDIGLIFVGEGASKPHVEALAADVPTVRFLPFRPRSEVPYVLAAGDVHIVTIQQGAEGVIVPSKLYPILAAGRPVLAVAPARSDVARLVTEHQCGLVANPQEPESVAAAIRQLHQNPAQLQQMGVNARHAAQQFERSKMLTRFVEVVDQVLQQSRP